MNTIFADSDTIHVDSDQIKRLKNLALQAPRGRSRLCLHRSHSDVVQKMVITVCRESYIPPHRQVGRLKFYHMIEGAMVVAFFNPKGRITERVEMGEPGSGNPFISHFAGEQWHTVVPLSDLVVYMEVIPGPYEEENTDFAAWAPDHGRPQQEIDAFITRILSYKT
jgi:glucose-6-phosphate isomerase